MLISEVVYLLPKETITLGAGMVRRTNPIGPGLSDDTTVPGGVLLYNCMIDNPSSLELELFFSEVGETSH